MLLNKNFFDYSRGEERTLTVTFLNKVGIEDPYDHLDYLPHEVVNKKVEKDVRQENFDLEGVEEKINVVFNHMFIQFTHSAYYDVISDPKRVTLKTVLSNLKKGLVELYQSEYDKETKRKEAKEQEMLEKATFEALIEELKK